MAWTFDRSIVYSQQFPATLLSLPIGNWS